MLVNLTGHDLVFPNNVTIKSDGIVRVELSEHAEFIENVKIVTRTHGKVVGDLPCPEKGKLYIVSSTVRLALPERSDLVSPAFLTRINGDVVKANYLLKNGD